MELKKLKCTQCETVADVYLLPSQTIHRCKSCKKLTRVVEHKDLPKDPPKKRKRKKNDE